MGRESNHASEIYFFLRIETVLLVSLTSRLLYEDTVPKQPWMGVRPAIRELLTTDARFCLQLAGNLECRVFPLHVFGSCHVVCVYVGPVGLVAPLIVHYNFFQLKCLIPQKTGEKLPGRVKFKGPRDFLKIAFLLRARQFFFVLISWGCFLGGWDMLNRIWHTC